jgi:excisionase family DNA binding protein
MAKQGPKLLRVGAAAHELGLHPMTVRRWIKAGRIQVVQMGREVRIPRAEIERMVGKLDGRLLVLYGRVSEHGQKDDLETQLERLQTWAKAERKGKETLILSDIGSGLKAGRRHLQRLLKLVCDAIAQAKGVVAMRTSRTHQPLTHDVRLPDEAQADAFRLLDESRAVVNAALITLWPYLDEFGSERAGPAWKQVEKYIGSPSPHGDRHSTRPAGKNRPAIKEPSPPCRRAWKKMRPALSRCKMWSSRVATFSSSTIVWLWIWM